MPSSRPPAAAKRPNKSTASAIRAADSLRSRAVGIARTGRSAQAIELLHTALRALPLDGGGSEAIEVRTKILATLAYAQAETGSVQDGLVHLGTARDLANGLPGGQRRLSLLGLVNKQHAIVLLRAGRTAEALEIFNQTIPLLEQADDKAALVSPLMNRGLAYILLGQPGPAERDMRRCIALYKELGQATEEAKAWSNLGDIAQLVGDIPGALGHYEQAERTFRRLAPDLVPRTQIDRAKALLTAGLADEATRYLDEALPELREQRITQDLAEAEVARAATALLLGDLRLAKKLASSARRRFRKRGSEPWAEVAALTSLRAEAEAALGGQTSSATPHKAADLAERLAAFGLRDEAAMARMLGVRLALRRGDVGTAEVLLAQVPAPRRIAPIDHKMMLRLCRAEVALARGHTRRALAQAKAGFDELGAARDRMGGLDLVCGTAVHGIELGKLAIGLVLASVKGDADARRLLAWQERTRAQVYRYEPMPTIDDTELAGKVTELRTALRTMQQARLERRPVAGLERRYAALQREVSRLGWHTSQWGRPRPVCTPDEIIEQLGDRALISFAAPGKDLAAIVVHGGRTRLLRLAERAEVLELVRQLRADLDALAPDHLITPLAKVVSESAQRRIRRLDDVIRPATELIGDRDLVVVPFDSLYSVPWEALPALRGRAVSVAPSATAWVGAARAEGADSSGIAKVMLARGPELPESVVELTRLRTIYPEAVVLDGEQATTGAVLSAMDGARLAHIAAHGTHEPANALFSRLELADGGLLAHEVARLSKPPEHIVLASCELAVSHIRPGDEALSFAGAMLASGSRTVVAAVSRVGDRTTAETMADYHQRLVKGSSPALALAEATAADPLRRPFICLGAG